MINKIVGLTNPTGEHEIDKKRLKNLKKLTEVVGNLIVDIEDVYLDYKGTLCKSERDIVLHAHEFLGDVYEELSDSSFGFKK